MQAERRRGVGTADETKLRRIEGEERLVSGRRERAEIGHPHGHRQRLPRLDALLVGKQHELGENDGHDLEQLTAVVDDIQLARGVLPKGRDSVDRQRPAGSKLRRARAQIGNEFAVEA